MGNRTYFLRISLFLLFSILFTQGYSLSSDSTKVKTNVSGILSFNSNGVAPIPAFSLGKPALVGTLSIQRRRFSYDPNLAYGLNFRPWIFDNWIRYRPILRPKFELRAGFNFSMFFSQYYTDEYKILQGQQYLTAELAGIFKMNPRNSLTLMLWSDNGQDHGSIKGYFYNVVYDLIEKELGKSILFSANVQLFYIDYTGQNDGLFLCPRLSASMKDIPVAPFFQFTQAITSKIVPFPGFQWNAGVEYLF